MQCEDMNNIQDSNEFCKKLKRNLGSLNVTLL